MQKICFLSISNFDCSANTNNNRYNNICQQHFWLVALNVWPMVNLFNTVYISSIVSLSSINAAMARVIIHAAVAQQTATIWSVISVTRNKFLFSLNRFLPFAIPNAQVRSYCHASFGMETIFGTEQKWYPTRVHWHSFAISRADGSCNDAISFYHHFGNCSVNCVYEPSGAMRVLRIRDNCFVLLQSVLIGCSPTLSGWQKWSVANWYLSVQMLMIQFSSVSHSRHRRRRRRLCYASQRLGH